MPPNISEGQDEGKVVAEADALLVHGWKLDEEQIGLIKTYYFKTYTKALVRERTIRIFKGSG